MFVPGVEGQLVYDSSAKTLGHEIGHLMGGHHHLGKYVEGELRDDQFDGCTLMASPRAMACSFQFSTVQ